MLIHRYRPLPVLLSAALALTAACGGGKDDAATDTAGGTTAATATATDTSMSGMDHSGMTMNRSAPRDSNQSFLRMMSDHHQGLIVMSDTAMGKLGATAKADAQRLRSDQKAEQERMVQMLSAQYSDSLMPMVMPSNQQMIQAVAQAGSGDADRVYYQQVIAHHREGVQMAEKMLPQLTGEPKQMATKSIEKQRKEIAEFEKKAGASR